MELVKLEKIDPTKQWPNEAHDFTPWLAEHLQELGDVIGYDLELEGREVPVGPYWADIVAKDINTNTKIVIENQLRKTDHDHLGKCITYTSVLDAKIVVWISPYFTDEHRKALEWLNDNTSPELSFFGIELSLLKIDKDKASVVFDVVVAPNEIVKDVKQQKAGLTVNEQKQLAFWNRFREAITSFVKHPQTARPQYWFDIALGKSGICLSNTYNTGTNAIGCRVYINNRIADKMLPFLEERKDQIESDLGFCMDWNPNPENRDKIITINKVFDMDTKEGQNEAIAWLKGKTEIVHAVFSKVVKQFRE